MKTLIITLMWLMVAPAHATPKTAILSVPTMNCSACPITIKKALTAVPGVSAVDVRYENRQATVTFDDAKTTLDALMGATKNAGYPSTLNEQAP